MKQYDVLNGNRFYLFFQDEVILEQFQEKINSISFTKEEIDRVLGTILGFPPKAINFYVQMWKEKIRGNLKGFEQMQNRKIGIIYCGCCFVSDVTDFQENVLWLLEKYPYEEAKLDGMFIRIGDERIQVPIGDIRQIRDFHEYIMHHVGVVPA